MTKLEEGGGWRLGHAPTGGDYHRGEVMRVTHWLSPGLLSTCRSGDDKPNGGVTGRKGSVPEKVHWRGFLAL